MMFTSIFLQTVLKVNYQEFTKNCIKCLVIHPQRYKYSTVPYKFEPNLLYIRKCNERDVVNITLQYVNEKPQVKKILTFERQLDDSIEKSFERMKTKIQKLLLKKAFGRRKPNDTEIQALIGDVQMSLENDVGETVEKVSWKQLIDGNSKSLQNCVFKVRSKTYSLALNYPHAFGTQLPACIMVGYDCYPSNLELQGTSRDECLYKWYKGLPNQKSPYDKKNIKWLECGETFSYLVKNEDVGYLFKLEITPKRGHLTGPTLEIISTDTATENLTNGFDAFKERHFYTTQRLSSVSNQFRVVSYNLLADFYTDSDYSRNELFPYCPPYALTIDYRKRLYIKEIRGYNSDIICLQEVDGEVFDGDLKLLLLCDGIEGWFLRKGHLPEGLATFYHHDKFELIQTRSLDLGEGIKEEPCLAQLFDKIKSNEKLCERMLPLPSALQVTILRSKISKRYLIVANTHLYSQLDAAHIRLLQAGFSMIFIRQIYENLRKELNLTDEDISLIFCGDFNSLPERDVLKFMTQKFVSADASDFKTNEAVTNVSLEHSFSIKSAYNPNEMYTNYTVGFKGCLDYIYYQSDNLKLVQTVPMQNEDILSANDAIPSIHFPSDHLALVADLEWLNNS